MTVRLAAVGLALLASGCAVGSRLVAPADEYGVYRDTHVARALDDRLAAADRYLAEYPEGRFADDVRGFVARAEPTYWESKEGSVAGVEAYLRTMPRGPHAALAVKRAAELRGRKAQVEDMGATAAAAQRSIERAIAERGAARAGFVAWLDRFLDPRAWRGPLSEAPAELVVPWTLSLPAPVCKPVEGAGKVARSCTKLVELPYSVEVDGRREPREITLSIEAKEDASGALLEVRLGGPDLWARVEETKEVRAIAPDDADRRLASLMAGLDLVRAAYEKRVAPIVDACKRPVVAPIMIDVACGVLAARVQAAGAPGEDDLVVISGP